MKPARDEHGLEQTDEEKIGMKTNYRKHIYNMENNNNIDQLQNTQGAWDSIFTGIEQ